MPSITIVGSLNMDLVVRVAHLPASGETILGRDYHTIPGGKGANQAGLPHGLEESSIWLAG
jgi:ribokinase